MQIKGIGIDLIEIYRVKKMFEAHPLGVKKKIFTEHELNYCRVKKDPFPHLAARFAAKEAVAKALGTGISGISWQEIEVRKEISGKIGINLSGKAKELAVKAGITKVFLSLSHSKNYAVAQAIALTGEE